MRLPVGWSPSAEASAIDANRRSRMRAATIRLTEGELVIVKNALNEVCRGIDVEEFGTRLGADKSEVRRLLETVNGLIDRLAANEADPPPDL